MSITNRIQIARQEIELICSKYNINIKDLTVLAVSKTHPATAIHTAFEAGITKFGESYLKEALGKIKELQTLPVEWHFIGPVQSNKTREIAANFDWVQSIDRSKILTRLNEQRPCQLPPLKVCIQINYFAEEQKKGCSRSDLPALLELAEKLPNINLRGLMAIPPKTSSFKEQSSQYQNIASFYKDCKQHHPKMDTLSIGMSGDMEAAIASGSTMVRLGTTIFGPRN